MKNVIVLLVALFAFANINAQTNQTAPAPITKGPAMVKPAKVKQIANPAAYACPHCYEITSGAGSCTKCNVLKVQLGNYYCAHCAKPTGPRVGKCGMCSGETVQITRKYCASHGGTPLKTKKGKM
jgi:hypothetical protein